MTIVKLQNLRLLLFKQGTNTTTEPEGKKSVSSKKLVKPEVTFFERKPFAISFDLFSPGER